MWKYPISLHNRSNISDFKIILWTISLLLLDFNIRTTKKAIIKQNSYVKVYNEVIIFLFLMLCEYKPGCKAKDNIAKNILWGMLKINYIYLFHIKATCTYEFGLINENHVIFMYVIYYGIFNNLIPILWVLTN